MRWTDHKFPFLFIIAWKHLKSLLCLYMVFTGTSMYPVNIILTYVLPHHFSAIKRFLYSPCFCLVYADADPATSPEVRGRTWVEPNVPSPSPYSHQHGTTLKMYFLNTWVFFRCILTKRDLLKGLAVPVMLEAENMWLGNIFKLNILKCVLEYLKMYVLRLIFGSSVCKLSSLFFKHSEHTWYTTLLCKDVNHTLHSRCQMFLSSKYTYYELLDTYVFT